MKNLKSLGKILNSNEQKAVYGGLDYPKKACDQPVCCYERLVYRNGWVMEVVCEEGQN
ncbi:hypothetical protein ABMY20_07940 [Tenacibaculum sp. SSH1-16]|uniref:Bacteriocin n=1 Tax=Tenacibaculum sp. Pbs-1 TaxID=3238748 RepID=A0AB33KZY2_9FLAO|nr:hypothetical protein [Tenacibaculum sp. XPcli2-G]MCO7184750.1 hypothetical protein [Tenacibaculum sp. XPcli2-G]BFF37169.1 hypothetical protein BACT7_20310 [Tenacibaculum mesophilum]BFF40550.1 hypothetical protein BACY1_23550 [Tenacibaculum mesophilum]